MNVTHCLSCKAPIVFLATKNGNRMPVDAHTVVDGDLMFDRARGHVAHFISCPKADKHRRRTR